MLESLCQGAGTIHELNLAGAFPERAPYRPRERYAALKATPLYDPERGQWKWTMSEERILLDTDRGTNSELYGVLVEAAFNPAEVLRRYEKVKATPLYDPKRGQWNWAMSEEQERRGMVRYAAAQLVGVLVEAQFNPEQARVLYEKLKTTPLYDAESGQWKRSLPAKPELQETVRVAEAQLLGVVVEAQFNEEAARVLYEKLKATALYDPERGQWNRSMFDVRIPMATGRVAATQLLGVLAEAQFNGASARVLYEKLKATPLYDPERREWNHTMTAKQELIHSDRWATDQLLGVLVEAKLLSTLPRALAEAVLPLPVVEEW